MKITKKKIIIVIVAILMISFIISIGEKGDKTKEIKTPTEGAMIAEETEKVEEVEDVEKIEKAKETKEPEKAKETKEPEKAKVIKDAENVKDTAVEKDSNIAKDVVAKKDKDQDVLSSTNNGKSMEFNGVIYKIIEVEGGNLSGNRQANVAVDVGYGKRSYWALTNNYGQLIHVIADKIILQNDSTEPVNSSGRYYNDEAKVPGTEHEFLDEGHVIADSLGGVSNAYNITPQNSTLNRHGDQAYMEKVIRDAGGCKNFVATITYPDKKTQTPSKYKYEYILRGNKIVDEFENANPEGDNSPTKKPATKSPVAKKPTTNGGNDLSAVDSNGNGRVTIAEAKAAGYLMPIKSSHWLYPHMNDRDGDGLVGE
jgi:hypothetical protein